MKAKELEEEIQEIHKQIGNLEDWVFILGLIVVIIGLCLFFAFVFPVIINWWNVAESLHQGIVIGFIFCLIVLFSTWLITKDRN